MSYETDFRFNIHLCDLEQRYDGNKYNRIIKNTLKKYYHLIENGREDSETTINDWYEFIKDGEGSFNSIHYENVNLYIQIAVELLNQNMALYVRITFIWTGEEDGDHTENTYHLRKVGDVIEATKDIQIIEEAKIDINQTLERDY